MRNSYSSLPSLLRLSVQKDAALPDSSSNPQGPDARAGGQAPLGRGTAHAAATPGSPLDAYRAALYHWWSMSSQGAEADTVEVMRVYQDIVRLLDEVGEPTATERRRTWAREWHRETGRCPTCGEPGAYHDPESQHG